MARIIISRYKYIIPVFLFVSMLSGCDRLGTLSYSPPLTPETMLKSHPHAVLSLGATSYILMEPSSSALVFILGFIAIGVGLYFLRIRQEHASRAWWGVSLLLWGIGALLAGVSYQSFGYEIKCAGREYCAWTSWWEIYYLLFSTASVNAMMMAVTRSSAGRIMKKALPVYAAVNTALYSVICLAGAFIPNTFLVSFELMVLFTGPSYIVFFVINTMRFLKLRERMDLLLMATWLLLGAVMAGYFVYFGLGLTEKLWSSGLWFSANDVLHSGLILWMLYIGIIVAKRVKDAPVHQ
jgi:hypothetical protein